MRFHRTGTGVRPGVTTVLGNTEDRSWMDAWIARVGADEAERIRLTATDRGSLVHAMIEAELTGEPLERPKFALGEPDPEAVASVFSKFKPVRRSIDEVIAIELDVEWFEEGADPDSAGNGYGGSIDCLAVVHGSPMILDWKTSAKQKRLEGDGAGNGGIDNYRQQIAAYRRALHHTYPDLWDKYGGFDYAAIVILPVSGALQVVEMEPGEIAAEEVEFFSRLGEFYESLSARMIS